MSEAVVQIILGGVLGWALGPLLDVLLAKLNLRPNHVAIWALIVVITVTVILELKLK